MTQDRSFLSRNAVATQQLKAVAARITDAELAQKVEGDWNVAAVFGHIAFWDRQRLALLNKWEQQGVQPADHDGDVFNEALLPLLLALPSRAAVQLALDHAEAIDRKLESISDQLLTAILALPNPPNLERAIHRREHLEKLERVGIRV